MRALLVILHRWFGLAAALFLFIAGLTGAVISWDHELDAFLNPQFYQAHTKGSALPALDLAARIEAAEPRARVTYLPLVSEPGHTAQVSVSPRLNPATGKLHDLNYNQVAVDPVSGEIQGRRYWGAISLARENLLPFLYKLHYSMHIPDGGGIEWGIWLMGLIGLAWVFDCLIALWLSFPSRASWRKSFAFRWSQGGHKLTFDLHRSGGVWLWLLVLMLAVTSVSMNLNAQVTRPVVSWFSALSPSPFASRAPVLEEQAAEPKWSRAQIVAAAAAEAARRGWKYPAGAVFLSPGYGLYGVGFFSPGDDHGEGLGNPWLYLDAQTGQIAGAEVPGTGTAGDIFLQAQFPLHSGRIIGVTGRILISVMGLVVAVLSASGLVIWARRQQARVQIRTGSPVLAA